jgi:tRNA pseudouridine13 synthase
MAVRTGGSRHASVLEIALAPPRAYGAPPARAVLREGPEDFFVKEILGFAPSGSGQHVLLKVRKRNANTVWVARELARAAGCRSADVGYAGLKDRRAVAVQWFSVPRPQARVNWQDLRGAEFEVLEAHEHTRKLPRGALAGNEFAVRVRAAGGDGAELAARLAPRLEAVAGRGVPNYFGPQRFGHEGANLTRAADLPRLGKSERGLVLSAVRSVIFNTVLAKRVRAGNWDRLLGGDLANLDRRGSVFVVPPEGADETLAARCARLEIHPTGPLWGEGSPPTAGKVLALESRVADSLGPYAALCVAAGMAQERRALRFSAHDLSCAPEPQGVVLRFRLGRGCFATTLLRELITTAGEVPAE